MYESLTGELPIQAPSRRELLDMHQRQVPEPMRVRRPDLDIPEALDEVVLKCLKKKAVDRPKDAAALEAMLAAIPLEGLPLVYPPGVGRKKASMPEAPKGQEEKGTMPKVEAEPTTEEPEP
jgi:serine/threonine-protein kinase